MNKKMKTIGLIGGMSWESTITYYQVINETVKKHRGGLHSAKILLYSVDFEEIERCQSSGDWNKAAALLTDAAQRLEKAGVDFIVICTNTMHKVVPLIQQGINIPVLHIAEATADILKLHGIRKVGLLGTKYTMTQDFYRNKLIERGIEVIIPKNEDIKIVNNVIYDELCCGLISPESKEKYLEIISKLQNAGAEAIVLGCTEIGLLIKQEDVFLPVYDTTLIHAEKAALMTVGDAING